METMCTICNELSGKKDDNRLFISSEGKISNAFLTRDAFYSVIPSIGALTKEHFLIVSNKHSNSILKYAYENAAFQNVEKLLHECYGKLITDNGYTLLCFEHGSFSNEDSFNLCSTVHSHLHILPIKNEDYLDITASFKALKSKSFKQMYLNAKKYDTYLQVFSFNKQGIRNSHIIDACNLPSQYMREIIGKKIKMERWDWKINTDNSNTLKAIEDYCQLIE